MIKYLFGKKQTLSEIPEHRKQPGKRIRGFFSSSESNKGQKRTKTLNGLGKSNITRYSSHKSLICTLDETLFNVNTLGLYKLSI